MDKIGDDCVCFLPGICFLFFGGEGGGGGGWREDWVLYKQLHGFQESV